MLLKKKEYHIRELLDSSWQGGKIFLLIIQQVMIKFLLIFIKNIFFQELKQKITTSKLMEETFIISQLMTQLSNTTKSEKYQQDKVMITRLVVCWILLILEKIQINCCWFKQTKSFKCWFKSNPTNYFYWQNKSNSSKYKSNNLLHSSKIKRSNARICKRNNKSSVISINGWIQ